MKYGDLLRKVYGTMTAKEFRELLDSLEVSGLIKMEQGAIITKGDRLADRLIHLTILTKHLLEADLLRLEDNDRRP